MLGRRGLRCANRIGRWKAVHQASLQSFVNLAIRQNGFAGIGRMLVMRRRIKLLSHEILPVATKPTAPLPGSSWSLSSTPRPAHQGTPRHAYPSLLSAPRRQLTIALDSVDDRLKNSDDSCFSK